MLDHLPGMHKVLGSIPVLQGERKKENPVTHNSMKEPLENTMLNEIHRAQRDKHYMSHLCVRAKGLIKVK